MEAKYVQGIKAGVIGGVVMGFCVILTLIVALVVSFSSALTILGLLNCCIFIFIIALMVGVGALGVKMAAADIATLTDALVVSAVAGAIAGLIAGLIYAIVQIVQPLIVHNRTYDLYGSSYGYSTSTLSALGAGVGICCCWPAILVISAVLAVVGGAIYAVVVLKVK